jgi:hypothetical protein
MARNFQKPDLPIDPIDPIDPIGAREALRRVSACPCIRAALRHRTSHGRRRPRPDDDCVN